MKKTFLKELLVRRIPQILGSYFIGATTLIFFIDWLVAKYGFSDYYTSLALFGLISILPSVIILAYFHGAPGKDEWTKVEKFGIPVNIAFIAIALFAGYKFNLWQEETPDHSKVYDNFIVNINSNQESIDQFKSTQLWTNYGQKYADFAYPLDNEELEKIRNYINVSLRKEFMNYKDIKINFPENQRELDMMDNLVSANYIIYLTEDINDEELQKKNDEESDIVHDSTSFNFDYFNNKHDTHIDVIYNIDIFKAQLSTKGKVLRNLAKLKNLNDEVQVYGYLSTAIVRYKRDNGKFSYNYSDNLQGYDMEGEESPIEHLVYETVLKRIKNASFGENIGEIISILDTDLVTIKLNNLDLIKGTDLICLKRSYLLTRRVHSDPNAPSDPAIDSGLRGYIDDYKIIYNYLSKYPDQIEKGYTDLDVEIDYVSTDDWLKNAAHEIDSLEVNFQTIINDKKWKTSAENWPHGEFRYYLRVLNVQDSIATAKITGSIYPFSKPKIGDKINIK